MAAPVSLFSVVGLRHPLAGLGALFPYYPGPHACTVSALWSGILGLGVQQSWALSPSLLTPHHPPGAGGRGARSRRAGACILPPLQGSGFSQVWMWSGCCPVSSGLYFRKSCLCYIFIDKCGFGRRFPLLYSCRRPGSAPISLVLYRMKI